MKNSQLKQLIKEEIQKVLKEGLSNSSVRLINKWIDELYHRGAALKLLDTVISRHYMGLTSSDFEDSPTFVNGLDTIEEFLIGGDFKSALETARETAREMAQDMGGGVGEWI